MGSPLSPPMAYFAMSMLEENIDSTPVLYKRYVDDIFCVFTDEQAAVAFLNKINNLSDEIKFTMGKKVNGKINFFDIQFIKEGAMLSLSWRKKSNEHR